MATGVLDKKTKFFIYLLERYAEFQNTTADVVLDQWDNLKLTDFIFNMYDIYHVERLQNAFEDIKHLIAEKQTAYLE